MGWIGVVGLIIEQVPTILGLVERFTIGIGDAKQVSAAKNMMEFIANLIGDGSNEFCDFTEEDIAKLEKALADDEHGLMEHITRVNDSVVGLINHINGQDISE